LITVTSTQESPSQDRLTQSERERARQLALELALARDGGLIPDILCKQSDRYALAVLLQRLLKETRR